MVSQLELEDNVRLGVKTIRRLLQCAAKVWSGGPERRMAHHLLAALPYFEEVCTKYNGRGTITVVFSEGKVAYCTVEAKAKIPHYDPDGSYTD